MRPLAILVAGAALTLGFASAASASTATWVDEAHDAPGRAPDVRDVSVEVSAGTVRWRIAVPDSAGFDERTFVDIYVDSDGVMATGWQGIDHYIRVGPTGAQFYVWTAAAGRFQPTAAPGLTATPTFPLEVTVSHAALGSPSVLWFWLRAWTYAPGSEPPCCFDDAPSAGFYRLDVPADAPAAPAAPPPGGAPGPPTPPPPPTVGGSTPPAPIGTPGAGVAAPAPSTTPTRALALETLRVRRSGRSVTVTATVIRDATGARVRRGSVRCSARAAGRTLRVRGRFVAGSATCRFAAAAPLRGTMTVAAGATLRIPFRAR